jgi:hypothetical protein
MPAHKPLPNVLMVKLPRTGSTYLAYLLGSHPRISFHHEYLNRYAERRQRLMSGPLGIRGVRRIVGKAIARAKWRGLEKLLTSSSESAVVGASINPFKEGLSEATLRQVVNPATRLIVLSRDNLLKQHISHLNVLAEKEAGTIRPYKSYNEDGRVTDRTLHVGPEAVAAIDRLERQRRGLFDIVESVDVPKLFLTYEEHIHVADKEPTLALLSEFLGVAIAPAWREDIRPVANAPKYHKLVSDDLRQVIENYDEIAANATMQKYL